MRQDSPFSLSGQLFQLFQTWFFGLRTKEPFPPTSTVFLRLVSINRDINKLIDVNFNYFLLLSTFLRFETHDGAEFKFLPPFLEQYSEAKSLASEVQVFDNWFHFVQDYHSVEKQIAYEVVNEDPAKVAPWVSVQRSCETHETDGHKQ